MKKKIYLIQPTYRNVDGHLLIGRSLFIHSLVLPILSAAIPIDWEKEFSLEYFEDINYETDASVVGISSMGYDLVHGIEIAEAFKRRGKIVIFGGYQAHFSRNRLSSVCDSIVFGNPGPHEMKKILGDIQTGHLAPEYHGGIDINFPGIWVVFFGRHLLGVRAQIFLVAGVMRMPARKFLLADALSALITMAIMIGIGYFGGSQIQILREDLARMNHTIMFSAVLIFLGWSLFRYFRRKKMRLN